MSGKFKIWSTYVKYPINHITSLVIDELLIELFQKGFGAQAYADDLAIFVRGKAAVTVVEVMQSALDLIIKWCDGKGLGINPIKTEVVLFTRRRNIGRLPRLTLMGHTLQLSNKVKFLGVVLDKKLLWGEHVNACVRKALFAFFVIRRTFSSTWGVKTKYVRWLYTSVVRPILTYGCVVWWQRTKLRTVQNELNKFQRLVCVGATGAFRTTPTASLQVLLYLPPLHTFIFQQAAASYSRLKITGAWNGPPMVDLGNLLSMPQDRIIAQVRPDDCFSVTLPSRNDWETNVPIPPSNHNVIIYTDGSLMEGNAGAGVFCEEPKIELAIPLGSYTSIFQAEVYAIMCALYECAMLPYGALIYICSDSMAAIMALASSNVRSGIVNACRKVYSTVTKHRSIQLMWVPGHSAIFGNEEADRLAKAASATLPMGPEPILPIGPATLQLHLRNSLRESFKDEWRSVQGLEHSKQTIRDPCEKYGLHLLEVGRKTTRIVIALLTGHGPFRSHLAKIGLTADRICRRCGLEEETAEHILCHCAALWKERLNCLGNAFLDLPSVRDINLGSVSEFVQKTRLWTLNDY